MMQQPVVVNIQKNQPNIVLRVLWFIFVGWWVGLIWLHLAYVLCVSVIFLPIGLLMLNRLPTILTLHMNTREVTYADRYGRMSVSWGEPPQTSFVVRALYFLLIGWWLGYLWAIIGYVLCFTIILLPLGVLMLNSLPTVLTLRRM
jgi:uncharacterized membrane protein YccF (DUF307 family)